MVRCFPIWSIKKRQENKKKMGMCGSYWGTVE
jgi:hypothetical protein